MTFITLNGVKVPPPNRPTRSATPHTFVPPKTIGTVSIMAAATLLSLLALTAVRPSTATAAEKDSAIQIVHLGDSYSAGNGARDKNGGNDYAGPKDCFRSPSSWGGQYANWLSQTKNIKVDYRNYACKTASFEHMSQRRKMDKVFVSNNSECPIPNHPEEEQLEKNEKVLGSTCQRWLRPQLDGITADTDLVLLTLGGNDVGFRSILTSCMTPLIRHPSTCKTPLSGAEEKVAGMEQELVDLLAEMRKRLHPNAKVVVVEYPHLVDDPNFTIREVFGSETFPAGKKIRDVNDKLSGYQQAAAKRANAAAGQPFVVFVDKVKPHFAGKAPDPKPFHHNPDGWFYEFSAPRIEEVYHMNPKGHQELANLLTQYGDFGAKN